MLDLAIIIGEYIINVSHKINVGLLCGECGQSVTSSGGSRGLGFARAHWTTRFKYGIVGTTHAGILCEVVPTGKQAGFQL